MDKDYQVVFSNDTLRREFEAWLDKMGWALFGPFPLLEDDLPTYGIRAK